jgi:hypothetical protein
MKIRSKNLFIRSMELVTTFDLIIKRISNNLLNNKLNINSPKALFSNFQM